MIERLHFAGRANAVINHPDVCPFVSFDDTPLPLDLQPVLEDRSNILLMSSNGGFLLMPKNAELTAYEMHTFFTPEGQGREVHDAAREMFEWMFTKTPALRIYTMTPDDCPHARPPISFGWRSYYSRPDLFTRRGVRIGAQFWRLDFWDWAVKQKRLDGVANVLWAVSILHKSKAEALSADWAEWSGEVVKCQ